MTKLFTLLSLVLFLWTNSYGQRKEEKKLATTLDNLIPKRLNAIAPGCVVLIAKKETSFTKKLLEYLTWN